MRIFVIRFTGFISRRFNIDFIALRSKYTDKFNWIDVIPEKNQKKSALFT